MAFAFPAIGTRAGTPLLPVGYSDVRQPVPNCVDLSADQIHFRFGNGWDPVQWRMGVLGDGCNCKVLHTARAAADGMEGSFSEGWK